MHTRIVRRAWVYALSMPTPSRLPNGRWPSGVSGAPPEKRLQPGHPWRYPKGVSGNPGGFTNRRREFERLQREALQDPELLKKAMVKLGEAIDHGLLEDDREDGRDTKTQRSFTVMLNARWSRPTASYIQKVYGIP